MQVPVVTVFVRHSADCDHAGDEFYKRCSCWKHFRWSHAGKQYRKTSKSKTWAGAERAKRKIELSYETSGEPIQPDKPVTVHQAIETFLRDRVGQG